MTLSFVWSWITGGALKFICNYTKAKPHEIFFESEKKILTEGDQVLITMTLTIRHLDLTPVNQRVIIE